MSDTKRPEPRKKDLKPGRGGFQCGMCGGIVKPRYMSIKMDGWHWHQKCWNEFLKG